MKVLRVTKSLDSNTKKFIDAKIISLNDNVYIIKNDNFKNKLLIEPDVRLYEILSLKKKGSVTKCKIGHLVIEPTMDCDLKCPICFTAGQSENISLDEIEKEISNYKNKIVSISGGEPTLRKDLKDIIRIIAKRNIPLLATHGLRLADYDYVKRLKETGLRHVTFSLNGLTDKSFIKTNGKELLKQKLRAIENLVRADFQFLLSMLLIRGVNEREIKSVVNLASNYSNNIKEVRIRSAVPIGRYVDNRPYFMSEMFDLTCKNLEIQKSDVYKELIFKKYLSEKFPYIDFLQKACGFSFYLKLGRKNSYEPLGRYLNLRDNSWIELLNNIYKSKKIYSVMEECRSIFRNSRYFIWNHNNNFLKISLRRWPDINTLDFQEHIQLCGSRYIVGKKKDLPVCYANIIHDY